MSVAVKYEWTSTRRKQVVRQASYLAKAITGDLAAGDTMENYLDRCGVLNQLEHEWRQLQLPRQWVLDIRNRYVAYGRSRNWPTNRLFSSPRHNEFPF